MKQLVQFVRSGEARVCELPSPSNAPGNVMVRTVASVISAGTERMIVEFASKNLLGKALSRPDLVKEMMAKVHRDGVISAGAAALKRLEQPIGLGYSSAGEIVALGDRITDLQIGDRVACAGAGYAVHAEFASVPRMLVAKIPDQEGSLLSFEEAAFTTIGSIALHAIRLASATLGETVAVLGLGLVGQLAVQLLHASGCQVIGMDPDARRCCLAQQCGALATATTASAMENIAAQLTHGQGVDSVLIGASASTNEPLVLAGEIAKDRATVIAIGAVHLELPRKRYYEKELKFRISRSYGPGRYDSSYEEGGVDYPIGFIRWTENRNMMAFLDLLRARRINIEPLITHRFQIEHAAKAYELLEDKHRQAPLAIVICYSNSEKSPRKTDLGIVARASSSSAAQVVRIGLIGAGAFARGTLIPVMRKDRLTQLVGVCTATGLTGYATATKSRFDYCTTDEIDILKDPSINAVVIATRHYQHARQIVSALENGKHVFCEKPLCLNVNQLTAIIRALLKNVNGHRRTLMVGYNRRYSPMARRVKEFVRALSPTPLVMHYRVNAGSLPAQHWTKDPQQGGGRILGEVCHFVDFLTFICGALPLRVRAHSIADKSESYGDNILATIDFSDGSIGSILYATNGDSSFSKERFEVYAGGTVAVIDDFRFVDLVTRSHRKRKHSWLRKDKGHLEEWKHFTSALKSGTDEMKIQETVAITLATFAIPESLRAGKDIEIDAGEFIRSALCDV